MNDNISDADLSATGECIDPQAMQHNALQEKMFKLRKKMPEELVADLDAMDEEALDAKIVEAEGYIHESEQAMEADEELTELKQKVKNAKAPYDELKKTQTNIVKYCTCRLDEMGKV